MFESRKATQFEQIEIIWNKREVFLLSLFDKERAEGFSITENKDVLLIHFRSEIKKSEPVFGPQNYFDPKAGAGYLIQPAGPGKLFAGGSFLSLYQHKDWWIRPEFFENIEAMPKRSQLLLTKDEEDYFAFVTVCGKDCRSDMQGSTAGIQVNIASNAGNRQLIEDISLVIAAGKNPYACCEKAVKEALAYLGRQEMSRGERQYPAIFNKLGWCSWDAFYQEVSHQGILDKLEEFAEKKLPLCWVLIDDGWLAADYNTMVLKDFDAAKEKFPQGLAACVQEIKERYGIAHVGVWHAIMGYWNGLEKGSRAEAAYQDEINYLPDGRILPSPEPGKAFRFYDYWHAFLKNECKIDFVKVDGQSATTLAYTGMETYGRASSGIQKGLNASAALHFQNNIINCMGMASEDMWHRPSSAIARSSDDFVPEAVHGFWEHALQNAYNSLLQGQFFYGDWDMFFSEHAENRQNSMLRAVSGGPVYVSDRVGKTNPAYIWPLIRKDGTILRCQAAGVPTSDCLLAHPLKSGRPLKIFNHSQDATVVAAFHLGEGACTGQISRTDFMGEALEYLVLAWTSREIYALHDGNSIPVQLEQGESELYYIIPKQEEISLLGILEKYLPGGCIDHVDRYGKHWFVRSSESGSFGFHSSSVPAQMLVNGEPARLLKEEHGFYQLELAQNEEYIIEIIL